MTRTFIQTREFVASWEKMGLGDQDLRRLELELLKNPKAGKVIRETGGLRKLRFAFENRGKSGSVRVCYVDFVQRETVYLVTAYPKNEKDDLSREECREIRRMIQMLERQNGE